MTDLLTATEYKNTSTGQDYRNLIGGGVAADQDAELQRKIHAATDWIQNSVVSCQLVAASKIEYIRTRVQRDGTLSLHPAECHLNQLVALSIGTHAANLVAVSDLTGVFSDQEQWIIPSPGFSGASIVQFGFNAPARGQLLAKLTHIAGWTNTTIPAPIAAPGAVSFVVADATGLTPTVGSKAYGFPVRIIDGGATETVTVTSVVGNTINCTALVNAHAAGAVLSTVPGDIKEAAAMATSAFLRARSSDAMVMQLNNAQPGTPAAGDNQRWKLLNDATAMLLPWARTR